MSQKKFNGAHEGGIPPGWDFPEAREAAAEGIDLWLLDSSLKMSPAERVRAGAGAARLASMLRKSGIAKHGPC
jgi:hypothetical protein